MAVIVITGGTAGVGKATALHFAKAGYDVGIIARDEQSLRSTEEELRRFGINACAVQADVADSKAVTDAANEIEYRLGAIDVWVNNAMGGMLAPFRRSSSGRGINLPGRCARFPPFFSRKWQPALFLRWRRNRCGNCGWAAAPSSRLSGNFFSPAFWTG